MRILIEGFFFVVITSILAVGGTLLVRRKVAVATLSEHKEVAGYMLSVLGTLYAILLGLIVVNVQNKYEQAKQMSETESNACYDIYHLTNAFPLSDQKIILGTLQQYVEAAKNEDWEEVTRDITKERTTEPYRLLWQQVTSYVPQNNLQTNCHSAMLASLDQLSDARRFRMVASHSGLSVLLWAVLVSGGILTIAFTYFFGVDRLLTQILMTAFVAIFLSMNLYLVAAYNNPYRAELGVKESGWTINTKRFSVPPSQLNPEQLPFNQLRPKPQPESDGASTMPSPRAL